jgi:hypothetical protein
LRINLQENTFRYPIMFGAKLDFWKDMLHACWHD